ncbi:MAG: TatD family hydrolase [Patescibacteria group bacterium]
MKYIDIHSHLDREDYGPDFEAVLARMKEQEVGAIAIGADFQSSKKAVEIAEANENVWACIGVHPEGISPKSYGAGPETAENNNILEFEKLVSNPKVVAIGECGLDYFFGRRSFSEGGLSNEELKKIQKELFKKHIEFAIKHDKPLMLHIRDAYDDALEILNNYKKEAGETLRGNVHFFAGNIDVAKKFLDLGFTMSFTGVITFTHDYDEVIKYIPQNSIMSETDAPFVAPIPFRGKRNEPVYVIEVIKKLAEIRGEDFETLNSAILANAKRVFAFLGQKC